MFLLLMCFAFSAYPQKKPQVIFFHSSHCKACLSLEAGFLPAMKNKYKEKLDWREFNTFGNDNNLSLLFSVAGRFKKQPFVPAILVGNTFMVGKDEITKNLDYGIKSVLAKNPASLEFTRLDLSQLFKNLSAFTIISLGLIDGINPCAFAVIIFFISFLTVYGYKKREIIWVGISYCFAVFLTYLLIGLGLFNFFYALSGARVLIKYFYYLVALFCFLLSGCAVYDYFKYTKTGQSDGLTLQLPAFLKKNINSVIGANLRERKERSLISLAATAFAVGFLVSILEAACTGQVYVPTIVFILKTTSMKLKAFAYLLLYNFMFILPLLAVFALSLLGVNSQKFNAFLKNNLAVIKILMAGGFFFLGTLILSMS